MPKGVPGSKAPHGTLTRYTTHRCRCESCRQAMREYQGTQRTRAEYDAQRYAARGHGTERGYTRGCRCDDCRQAATSARRRRRKSGQILTHNNAGYSNGCRCDICTKAHTEYTRRYRARAKAAA